MLRDLDLMPAEDPQEPLVQWDHLRDVLFGHWNFSTCANISDWLEDVMRTSREIPAKWQISF
jgi:hypothetical protein